MLIEMRKLISCSNVAINYCRWVCWLQGWWILEYSYSYPGLLPVFYQFSKNILKSTAYPENCKLWLIFSFVEAQNWDVRMLDDALLTNLWPRFKRSESFWRDSFNQVVFYLWQNINSSHVKKGDDYVLCIVY